MIKLQKTTNRIISERFNKANGNELFSFAEIDLPWTMLFHIVEQN